MEQRAPWHEEPFEGFRDAMKGSSGGKAGRSKAREWSSAVHGWKPFMESRPEGRREANFERSMLEPIPKYRISSESEAEVT